MKQSLISFAGPARFLTAIAPLLLSTAALLAADAPQNPLAPASAPAPVMRFQPFVINDDPTYTGMEVSRGLMPAGWKCEGGVVWELADGFPAQFRIHFSDAHDIAAFDLYPNQYFYWSASSPRSRQFPPGSRYSGSIVQAPPADQFRALFDIVVPRYRPDLRGAKVVKQERLPHVSEAIFRNTPPFKDHELRVASGRVRFEYEVHGQPVEEDMTIVLKSSTSVRLQYLTWSIDHVSSVRAPKGMLDEVKAIRQVVQKSATPNIKWFNKVTQFIEMRQKISLDQLKEQAKRQEIIRKLSDEVTEIRKKQFEDYRAARDKSDEATTETMRDTTPWNTTDGGKVELPTKYGYAWQGANGEVVLSNDPRFNPNSDPNYIHTNWTNLQQAK